MVRNIIALLVVISISATLALADPRVSKHMIEEEFHGPESDDELQPYNFMYNHKDSFGTMQHREENKDKDGVITGSYGYRDPKGIYRHVSYIADSNGFHAVLRSNEPGIENMNSADVAVVVQ